MASSLNRLRRISRENAARPQAIDDARADGYTWEQIADALGMSRAGVIKLHNKLTDPPE